MNPRLTLLTALLPLVTASAQDPATPTTPRQRSARIMPAPAQQPQTQEELIEKRAAKLAKPVFQKADWTFDFDAAKERAGAEGKLVLVYFTRSYAH